jgi:hypothetical protein
MKGTSFTYFMVGLFTDMSESFKYSNWNNSVASIISSYNILVQSQLFYRINYARIWLIDSLLAPPKKELKLDRWIL